MHSPECLRPSLPRSAGGIACSTCPFADRQRNWLVEHGLEFGPATPENEPARSVIALAVLMAAETRQRVEEVMDGQILADFPVTPQAQHLHVVRREDRRSPDACWRPARRLASRRFSSVTATTDSNAIAGSNRAVVVNCMSSIWQPVFCAL